MLMSRAVRVSRQINSTIVCADFMRDTGRLRILRDGVVVAEWFPPHSWFEIASVAGYSTWGTRPNEQDLSILLDSFESRQLAVNAHSL